MTKTTTRPTLADRLQAEVDFRAKMTEVRKAPPAPARYADTSDRPAAPPAPHPAHANGVWYANKWH